MNNLSRTTMLYKPMMGSGGGGQQSGSSTEPTNTPDTLRSADSIEVILGLGEGKWKGLVNGAKSFLVGDTFLQNSDGSLNFEYFELEFRPGLPESTADYLVPKLGGTSSNIAVSTPLSFDIAVIRQMTENQIDAIDLRFNIAQLFRTDNTGTYTTELDLVVEIKKNTDSVWRPAFGNATLPIKGKTTGTYVKELRIPVARTDDFWQIRVTKLTADTDTTHAADVTWDSIQMINMDLKKYPDTATCRVFAKATNQFSSVPQFSGIYDRLEVKIPTNYNPVTRTSSGVWDGTFKVDYTNNPAWVVYDMVLNSRYGMSSANQLNMDKYEVADLAAWCDEQVDNGDGGFRPRYTLNIELTDATSAIEMGRYLAGAFNATMFDDNNGTIILRADTNQDATHMFTPEMVTEEGFIYSFTDINSRYNDFTVSFLNPDLLYQEDRRRVFNQDHIDEFGRIPLDFIAVGCADETEAIARANYKLLTCTTEKMLVSFTTNRMGCNVQPYEVTLIADPTNGYALSGRIKSLSVDRKTVFLRDPLHLEVGISYTMQLPLATGLSGNYVVSVPSTGSVTQFNVATALPSDLQAFAAFYLAQDPGVGVGSPKPFRIMKMEELDDSPDHIKITAIEVNRNKFTDAETGIIRTPTQFSGIGDPNSIPGPTNVEFYEKYNLIGNELWTILTVTLPKDVYRYYTGDFLVYSRQLDDDDNPIGSFEQRIVQYGDTIVNHPSGTFEFKILPKNSFGVTPPIGSVASWMHTVSSTEAAGTPPDPVEDIVYQLTPTGFIVQWTPPSGPGQAGAVHHYLVKEGATEGAATILADNLKDPILVLDPMVKRTYNLYIYAVSIAGVPSDAETVTIANTAPAVPTNIKVMAGYETLMVTFDRNTEIDIVGSRIQYRKVGDVSYTDMDPNGLLDTVIPDTAYEFRVASLDALTLSLNDEIWSSPYSIRTADTLGVAKGIDDVQASTTQNLVRNGSFERGNNNWTFVNAAVSSYTLAPYVDPISGTTSICQVGDGVLTDGSAVSDQFVVRPNQQYAIGCDFKADATHPGESHIFTLRAYDSSHTLITEFDEEHGKLFVQPGQISTTEFTRLTTVFLIPPTSVYAEVLIQSRGTGKLYIDGVQAQRGAVATAFNPHVSEELSAEDLSLIGNPDSTPPGLPTALVASAAFRTVTLTYTPPADADVDHFDIFRSLTNSLSSALQVGSSLAGVFVDSDVLSGVTYYYWVRAVDRSSNLGTFTSSVSATTTPLTAADFANLSIVNAMIANAAIDDAKIATVSAGKLTAGTITAGLISLGNDRFVLDSASRQQRVQDDNNVVRVRLGRLGAGANDYGIQVYDSSGNLVLGADGLGVSVVGTGNLANGAVTGDKIVANAISADKLAVNSVTAAAIVANAITTAALQAGAVTADKIAVASLSAITANLGTITAGVITAAGANAATNFWNLNTGAFSVGKPDGTTYLRYNPTTGAVEVQGTITVSAPTVNWTDVQGRPTTLADLDSAASTKLGGITAGADVTSSNTAANTANVGSVTTAQAVATLLDPAATINQNATTISGGLITTGSIAANKISVATLSSLTANVGTLRAGIMINAGNTAFVNLDATGGQQFINSNNNFIVDALGNVTMNSGSINGNLLVAGTVTAGAIAGNALSDFGSGNNGVTVTVDTNEKLLFWINYFYNGIPDCENPFGNISPYLSNIVLSTDGVIVSAQNGGLGGVVGPGMGNFILTIAPGTYTFRVYWRVNLHFNLSPAWWYWVHYPNLTSTNAGVGAFRSGATLSYTINYLKLKK